MNVTVSQTQYYGETIAVPSKSHAHRLLIAAALKKGETVIKNIGESDDVLATAQCLCQMGATVTVEKGEARVSGIYQVKKGGNPDACESGSTLRFLMPVAAALGAECTFTGKGRLFARPSEELCRVLKEKGAYCDGKTVRGQIVGGEYEIDATISSQYLSGLLFALPLLAEDSKIILRGEPVSKNYIDMTLDVLKRSGISFEKTPYGFFVPGRQQYKLPDLVECEGDWSSAAFMLAAGAVGKKVSVRGLDIKSLQGDKKIIDVLRLSGAKVNVQGQSVSVERGENKPFEADIENIPDLAPILAVVAAGCTGVSRLLHVHRLKIKESDRLEAIKETLSAAGITAKEENDTLIIEGGNPKCGNFDGKNDHRMVMSAAILAGGAKGDSTITDCEAVKKSYPGFFEDYKKIGGIVHVDLEG